MCRVIKNRACLHKCHVYSAIFCVSKPTQQLWNILLLTHKKKICSHVNNTLQQTTSVSLHQKQLRLLYKPRKKNEDCKRTHMKKFTYWLDKNWQRAFYQRFQCHLTGIYHLYVFYLHRKKTSLDLRFSMIENETLRYTYISHKKQEEIRKVDDRTHHISLCMICVGHIIQHPLKKWRLKISPQFKEIYR